MQTQIDSDLLACELAELAAFSDVTPPAVTRIVFSKVDLQARAWLKQRFQLAGLHVREDAVGNTFARWEGSNTDLSAIGTGSHIDAIPHAGQYDGTVGVLGGLEAIRALQRSGFVPQRAIELLLFTSEEPTRFGIGCLGSRLLSGVLNPQTADDLRDNSGDSLSTVRHAAGFAGPLASIALSTDYFAAFVELHIEQGPLLEAAQVPIGIVTNIAAPASLRVIVEGDGGHAGAVLMPGRRDALTAAAQIILAVERLALATGAVDTVATTGVCDVFPGAVNSIPSRVTLAIDIRDTDLQRRDDVVARIKDAAGTIAQQRGLTARIELLNANEPAQSDPALVKILEQSCHTEAVSYLEMVSRAYHDSLFMARIAPIAMLFIPCRGGISHRPDEFSSLQDITTGVRVLARALAELSS